MTPPSHDTTRPRRPDELSDQIVRHLRRLDRAITELDVGDQHALDDIVIAIRSLAGQGKGNHTLTQLAREIDNIPAIHPFTPPAGDDPAITFATGALPIADGHTPANGDRRPRSLGALMNLRCLTVAPPEDNKQRTYNWDQLVSTVASKLGAVHSDTDVPVALDEIQRFEISGQRALAHALRNLAVVISRHGHALLAQANIDHPLAEPDHAIPPSGQAWVADVQIRESRRPRGNGSAFTFNPSVTPPPPGHQRATHPGTAAPTRTSPARSQKVGRNDQCPCGSGAKYKRCCGR